jgi:hypothetical protein
MVVSYFSSNYFVRFPLNLTGTLQKNAKDWLMLLNLTVRQSWGGSKPIEFIDPMVFIVTSYTF